MKTFDTSLLCLVCDQTSLLMTGSCWGRTSNRPEAGRSWFCLQTVNCLVTSWAVNVHVHQTEIMDIAVYSRGRIMLISCWCADKHLPPVSGSVSHSLHWGHAILHKALNSSMKWCDFCEDLCFVGPKVDQLKVLLNIKLFIFSVIGTSVIHLVGSSDGCVCFFVQTHTTSVPNTFKIT